MDIIVGDSGQVGSTRFIEYSAYEALEKELKEARARINELLSDSDLAEHLHTKLEARSARLIEAVFALHSIDSAHADSPLGKLKALARAYESEGK